MEDYQFKQFLNSEYFVAGRLLLLANSGCGHCSRLRLEAVVDVLVVLSLQWMGVACECDVKRCEVEEKGK